MELGSQIAKYLAFAYGLVHLIASNVKLLIQTRSDIQAEDAKRRAHFATHRLNVVLVRIGVLTITLGITVRYADLKSFWAVLLIVYMVSFIGAAWLTTKPLPDHLPKISPERAERKLKMKWWLFAFQFVLMTLWIYSWRHLFI